MPRRAKLIEIKPGHPDYGIDEKVRKSYPNECQHQKAGLVCGRKHYARGLCYAHYKRMERYGNCGPVYIYPPPEHKLKGWMVLYAKEKIAKGEWRQSDAARYFKVSRGSMSEAVRGVTFQALTAPTD